jgi:hypothetical protein
MSLSERMAKIMAEVPAIGKEKNNAQQGFKYRGIDDVYNALQPLFAKHGVFVLPEVLESKLQERKSARGNPLYHVTIKMSVHFVCGESEKSDRFTATVYGEGMDSGDKAFNKAMSVGMKYAMFQTFLIPTMNVDPDSETHETMFDDAAALARLDQLLKDGVKEGLLDEEQAAAARNGAGPYTEGDLLGYIGRVENRLNGIKAEIESIEGRSNDDNSEEIF